MEDVEKLSELSDQEINEMFNRGESVPMGFVLQPKTRPIKTAVKRDVDGKLIIPPGYRYVPEIKRVRNGKSEIIREHCRLIKPIKQRMSLKRRLAELQEASYSGNAPITRPPDNPEINLVKFRIVSNIRRKINAVLDSLEEL